MSGLSLIRALDGSDMNETARILDHFPGEVTSRDGEDRVALHYAAETADEETFRRILELDSALIDCQDHNGYTPLLIASMSGNISAMNVLIVAGAQINHIDKDKHSAVHWAVVCGQFDALVLLLNKGANVNASDSQDAQPLHYATITEDIPHERSQAIIHILIKNGAAVNGKDIDGRTPILWAASNGNTEAMQSLIQAGGDRHATDRDQLSALHCAASHGHEHVLELLIESSDRSIIDATDRNGDTALFYAVTLGHYECARLLLLSGANPNHQDLRLRTPAHCAAAKGQLRMLKVLKHFGSSFEIQNRRGDIPLHEAIQAGSKDVVEWLLALHPSTVDSANHEGRTGLHLAAASGSMEIVVMLCSKNADINPVMLYKDTLYTPLDLAKKKDHELIVEYLSRRHSARSASQIPEESRKDWMTKLEEQIEEAFKQGGYRRFRPEEFDRNFEAGGKLERRRSESDNMTEETQTCSPVRKPAATNTSRAASRRASSASPRTRISGMPKATSTTDLTNAMDDISIREAQAFRTAVDERIQEIVQKEIQNALMNEEELRRRTADDAESNPTQSGSEADSVIAYPAVEESENRKKKKKAINVSSSKSKSKSRRNGDSEAKENVSPVRSTAKKSKARGEEESDDDATVSQSTKRSCDSDGNPVKDIRGTDYSSTEESVANSISVDALQGKPRRTLRDTATGPSVHPRGKRLISKRQLHEKAIFQELTHMKKMQIQYGKANERVLVRSLIGNFCKMHELNPAHFKFRTFYEWEKFLYDQLKLVYMEERQRLQNSRPPPNARFELRLRQARAIPIGMRGSDLTRMSDEQSSSAKSTRKSVNSRGLSTDKLPHPGGKRCECLGNHILIK